jgi:hypothetical protein
VRNLSLSTCVLSDNSCSSNRALIYPSNLPEGARTDVPTPDELNIADWERVNLFTKDGETLNCYFLKARKPEHEEYKPEDEAHKPESITVSVATRRRTRGLSLTHARVKRFSTCTETQETSSVWLSLAYSSIRDADVLTGPSITDRASIFR